MNFKDIKSKFLLYLQESMIAEGKDPKGVDFSAKSIFLYQDDFKNFLKEELNITDSSILTISVSDILKMNAAAENNSETFDSNEENPEEAPESEEAQEGEDDKNNWLKEFVNELLGDKDIKSKIDKDKNDEINDDELNNFLNSVKNLDGDENSISLDDLFKTYEGIKDGTFKLNEDSPETPEEAQEAEEPEVSETPDTSTSNPSGGTDPTTSTTNPSGNNDNLKESNDGSIENMSEDQLKQEQGTVQSDIDKNQAILQSIASGDYSGDSEFADMKKAMDDAYKKYTDALDDEKDKELKKVLADIQTTETQIAQKEADISKQNTTVENAKTNSENAKATFESMDAAYNALLAQRNSNDLTDEEKSELEGKINAAKERRDQAEKDAQKAQEDYEAEKEKLSDLEKELNELKTGENGLDKLKAQKETLEANIDKDSDAGKLMTEYNDAKSRFDAKKSELQTKARDAISASQSRLNEVNKALNTKKDENEISEKYKFSSTGDLFSSDVKMVGKMYTDEKTGMQYYLMAPEGTDPTKDELPMLLYLHGGTGGTYGQSAFESIKSSPGVFLKDTKFKGYIACPVLPAGYNKWDDDRVAAKLDNFLTSFCDSHKVNQDKIALAGVSLGGSGTVYMANSSLKKWFCKAAAISPARGGLDTSSSKIPLKLFFASNDGDNCISYQNYLYSKFKNADITTVGNRNVKSEQITHTWAAAKAFEQTDSDGNSSLLKWLMT